MNNTKEMQLVIVESPYFNKNSNIIVYNKMYAFYCLKDCLINHNESPYASHLLYTKFLDDNFPEQRSLGIEAGLLWSKLVNKTVLYVDLGISSGMNYAYNRAIEEKRKVEFRELPKEYMSEFKSKYSFLKEDFLK